MEFKQVVFRALSDYDDEPTFSGIAAYDSDGLKFVICACHGSMLEPDEVEIVKEYADWINLTDTIKGDD